MRTPPRAAAAALLLALAAPGCSVLIQPDENRLELPALDASRADGTAGDGPAGDGAADVVVPTDTPRPDVVVPPDAPPDAPVACPGGCDDGVACTVDRCDEATRSCVRTPDATRCGAMMLCDPMMGCVVRGCGGDGECNDRNACNGDERCVDGRCVGGAPLRCDDGRYCNGVETCDPTAGCRPGAVPSCDDFSPCTADRCNPAAAGGVGACESVPVDADGDGVPARTVGATMCGGGDCNDADRTIRPGAMELCNGRDDDCNGMVDDGPTCTPPNDACDAPTPITLAPGMESVMVSGTTLRASSGLTSSCGRDGGGDVWYAVTYPATMDLRLEVQPTGPASADPVLVVRDSCGGNDLVCNDDAGRASRASRVWVRAPVGAFGTRTLRVAVDSYQRGTEGTFTFRASVTARVAGGLCGSTLFDLSEGGSVLAQMPGRGGVYSGTCTPASFTNGTEEVYFVNVPMGPLDAALFMPTGRQSLYIRQFDCGSGRELACSANTPVAQVNPTFGGGRAFLFVDGAAAAGGTWYVARFVRP